MNQDEIRNPHLIYPGYVIVLDRARGRLTIGSTTTAPAPAPAESSSSAPREPSRETPQAGSETQIGGPAGTAKLGPRTRSTPLAKEQIPSIPSRLIEPFLTRPLIVEPDGLDKAPTIVGTQTDRVILSAGNSAYVRGIGGSKEDTWYVYRRGVPLVDPDTNQTLAYEAVYLGTARLTRGGDPATVVLTTAVQEVAAGDKLIAAAQPQPVNYVPHAPSKQIDGRVMSIYGNPGKVGEAGPQSILTINRGARDGLEVGHVLALYSMGGTVRDVTKAASSADARIRLPDERAGLAFVFRVFDRVSYALVMNLSRPIGPLDVVRTP